MSLNSSIMPKLDYQMSRIWIEVASPSQLGQKFDENFLCSKHILKVYSIEEPSRKKKFIFIPDPILPVWLKIGHVSNQLYLPSRQVAAVSNEKLTGHIDGVGHKKIAIFECCFLRQINWR